MDKNVQIVYCGVCVCTMECIKLSGRVHFQLILAIAYFCINKYLLEPQGKVGTHEGKVMLLVGSMGLHLLKEFGHPCCACGRR